MDIALTIFGFLYVAVFFSFIVFTNNKTYGGIFSMDYIYLFMGL